MYQVQGCSTLPLPFQLGLVFFHNIVLNNIKFFLFSWSSYTYISFQKTEFCIEVARKWSTLGSENRLCIVFLQLFWLFILCTVPKIRNKPEMKLSGLVPNFYIYVSVSDSYISMIGPQTLYSKIGAPIVGIYKSFTDTWMQKLGRRPDSFISGNICFEFSVQCGLVWSYSVNLFSLDRRMINSLLAGLGILGTVRARAKVNNFLVFTPVSFID
jgi:hypothetical protein